MSAQKQKGLEINRPNLHGRKWLSLKETLPEQHIKSMINASYLKLIIIGKAEQQCNWDLNFCSQSISRVIEIKHIKKEKKNSKRFSDKKTGSVPDKTSLCRFQARHL